MADVLAKVISILFIIAVLVCDIFGIIKLTMMLKNDIPSKIADEVLGRPVQKINTEQIESKMPPAPPPPPPIE